ncbi:MAG: hypothetical protein ACI4XB_01580 [Ruminococcus sp.]
MWECPRCHEQNENYAGFCQKCKESRPDLKAPTDSSYMPSQNIRRTSSPISSAPLGADSPLTSSSTRAQHYNVRSDNAYNFGIVVCIIGIILGAILLIIGITFGNGYMSTDYTLSASFGGDFYTYIYQATQNAANNLRSVMLSICALGKILKAMTCGMGGFIMLFSLITMSRMMSRKKYENAVLRQNEAMYMLLQKHLKEESEEK